VLQGNLTAARALGAAHVEGTPPAEDGGGELEALRSQVEALQEALDRQSSGGDVKTTAAGVRQEPDKENQALQLRVAALERGKEELLAEQQSLEAALAAAQRGSIEFARRSSVEGGGAGGGSTASDAGAPAPGAPPDQQELHALCRRIRAQDDALAQSGSALLRAQAKISRLEDRLEDLDEFNEEVEEERAHRQSLEAKVQRLEAALLKSSRLHRAEAARAAELEDLLRQMRQVRGDEDSLDDPPDLPPRGGRAPPLPARSSVRRGKATGGSGSGGGDAEDDDPEAGTPSEVRFLREHCRELEEEVEMALQQLDDVQQELSAARERTDQHTVVDQLIEESKIAEDDADLVRELLFSLEADKESALREAEWLSSRVEELQAGATSHPDLVAGLEDQVRDLEDQLKESEAHLIELDDELCETSCMLLALTLEAAIFKVTAGRGPGVDPGGKTNPSQQQIRQWSRVFETLVREAVANDTEGEDQDFDIASIQIPQEIIVARIQEACSMNNLTLVAPLDLQTAFAGLFGSGQGTGTGEAKVERKTPPQASAAVAPDGGDTIGVDQFTRRIVDQLVVACEAPAMATLNSGTPTSAESPRKRRNFGEVAALVEHSNKDLASAATAAVDAPVDGREARVLAAEQRAAALEADLAALRERAQDLVAERAAREALEQDLRVLTERCAALEEAPPAASGAPPSDGANNMVVVVADLRQELAVARAELEALQRVKEEGDRRVQALEAEISRGAPPPGTALDVSFVDDTEHPIQSLLRSVDPLLGTPEMVARFDAFGVDSVNDLLDPDLLHDEDLLAPELGLTREQVDRYRAVVAAVLEEGAPRKVVFFVRLRGVPLEQFDEGLRQSLRADVATALDLSSEDMVKITRVSAGTEVEVHLGGIPSAGQAHDLCHELATAARTFTLLSVDLFGDVELVKATVAVDEASALQDSVHLLASDRDPRSSSASSASSSSSQIRFSQLTAEQAKRDLQLRTQELKNAREEITRMRLEVSTAADREARARNSTAQALEESAAAKERIDALRGDLESAQSQMVDLVCAQDMADGPDDRLGQVQKELSLVLTRLRARDDDNYTLRDENIRLKSALGEADEGQKRSESKAVELEGGVQRLEEWVATATREKQAADARLLALQQEAAAPTSSSGGQPTDVDQDLSLVALREELSKARANLSTMNAKATEAGNRANRKAQEADKAKVEIRRLADQAKSASVERERSREEREEASREVERLRYELMRERRKSSEALFSGGDDRPTGEPPAPKELTRRQSASLLTKDDKRRKRIENMRKRDLRADEDSVVQGLFPLAPQAQQGQDEQMSDSEALAIGWTAERVRAWNTKVRELHVLRDELAGLATTAEGFATNLRQTLTAETDLTLRFTKILEVLGPTQGAAFTRDAEGFQSVVTGALETLQEGTLVELASDQAELMEKVRLVEELQSKILTCDELRLELAHYAEKLDDLRKGKRRGSLLGFQGSARLRNEDKYNALLEQFNRDTDQVQASLVRLDMSQVRSRVLATHLRRAAALHKQAMDHLHFHFSQLQLSSSSGSSSLQVGTSTPTESAPRGGAAASGD